MAQRYDIIVVGAGPAGALVSLILARAGKRVLLLEKSGFPRPKVCGNCLNPGVWSIWERHGLVDGFRELPHHSLEGIRLERDEQTLLRRNFESLNRPFCVVDREILDGWLVQEAIRSGVEFLHETRVQTVSFSGKVETSVGDFEADLILGADGRNSLIARMTGLMASLQDCERVGWQAQMDAENVGSDFHLRFFKEGYCGFSRMNEKTATLWMVLDSKVSGVPQKIANRFFPKLPALVWHSITPVMRNPPMIGKGSIWLVGDAAGVVEPLTGEGVYFALQSAEMAAKAILGMKGAGELAGALLQYQREYQLQCRSRFEAGALMRWFMKRSERVYRYSPLIRFFPGPVSQVINRLIHLPEIDA